VLLSLLFGQENHLSLCSIGAIAIKVTASDNPPLALPSLIPTSDQSNIARTASPHMSKPNRDKSRNESSDPFIGLQLEEVVDPVRIVHVLDSFVSQRVVRVYELLEGVGEVVLVRKIPKFIGEQLVQSLQVFPVLLAFLFSEAEVLHFEYLEDLPVKDLSNQGGLSDGNEVVIHFHLNDTVDCLDLYFLSRGVSTFLKLWFLGSLGIFLHEV
jgi:hypothetical protein